MRSGLTCGAGARARAPVRMRAPAATASGRNVAVVSCLSPVGQPKQQWPQVWPGEQLRGISPQCTPSACRPSLSTSFCLLCSRMPARARRARPPQPRRLSRTAAPCRRARPGRRPHRLTGQAPAGRGNSRRLAAPDPGSRSSSRRRARHTGAITCARAAQRPGGLTGGDAAALPDGVQRAVVARRLEGRQAVLGGPLAAHMRGRAEACLPVDARAAAQRRARQDAHT